MLNSIDIDVTYRDLMNKVEDFSKVVDLYTMVRADTMKSIDDLTEKYNKDIEFLEKFKKAIELLQKITDTRNSSVKQHIKGAINNGINAMLQRNAYTLTIDDDDRGTNKITNIEFISNETGKPRKVGTAVKQSSSLVFITTILKIAESSKFIALDEYLGGASGETAKKLSDILVSLAKNDEFQMFIVNHVLDISHNPEMVRYYFKRDSEKEGLKLDVEKTKKDIARRQELIELTE